MSAPFHMYEAARKSMYTAMEEADPQTARRGFEEAVDGFGHFLTAAAKKSGMYRELKKKAIPMRETCQQKLQNLVSSQQILTLAASSVKVIPSNGSPHRARPAEDKKTWQPSRTDWKDPLLLPESTPFATMAAAEIAQRHAPHGSQTVQRTSLASSLPPSLSFLPEAQPARAVVGIQLQRKASASMGHNTYVSKATSPTPAVSNSIPTHSQGKGRRLYTADSDSDSDSDKGPREEFKVDREHSAAPARQLVEGAGKAQGVPLQVAPFVTHALSPLVMRHNTHVSPAMSQTPAVSKSRTTNSQGKGRRPYTADSDSDSGSDKGRRERIRQSRSENFGPTAVTPSKKSPSPTHTPNNHPFAKSVSARPTNRRHMRLDSESDDDNTKKNSHDTTPNDPNQRTPSHRTEAEVITAPRASTPTAPKPSTPAAKDEKSRCDLSTPVLDEPESRASYSYSYSSVRPSRMCTAGSPELQPMDTFAHSILATSLHVDSPRISPTHRSTGAIFRPLVAPLTQPHAPSSPLSITLSSDTSLSGSSTSSELMTETKVGVGACFRRSNDSKMFQITSLREGSGAQLCQNIGIGDYIVAIDGEAVTGFSLIELAGKLTGPVGSVVECSFKKEGSQEVVSVSLHRTIMPPPSSNDQKEVERGDSTEPARKLVEGAEKKQGVPLQVAPFVKQALSSPLVSREPVAPPDTSPTPAAAEIAAAEKAAAAAVAAAAAEKKRQDEKGAVVKIQSRAEGQQERREQSLREEHRESRVGAQANQYKLKAGLQILQNWAAENNLQRADEGDDSLDTQEDDEKEQHMQKEGEEQAAVKIQSHARGQQTVSSSLPTNSIPTDSPGKGRRRYTADSDSDSDSDKGQSDGSNMSPRDRCVEVEAATASSTEAEAATSTSKTAMTSNSTIKDDESAARMSRSYGSNAARTWTASPTYHHAIPASMETQPDNVRANVRRGINSARIVSHLNSSAVSDDKDPELTKYIIEDLLKHNNELRSQLEKAVKDGESMLQAASSSNFRKAWNMLGQLRRRVSTALVYRALVYRAKLAPQEHTQASFDEMLENDSARLSEEVVFENTQRDPRVTRPDRFSQNATPYQDVSTKHPVSLYSSRSSLDIATEPEDEFTKFHLDYCPIGETVEGDAGSESSGLSLSHSSTVDATISGHVSHSSDDCGGGGHLSEFVYCRPRTPTSEPAGYKRRAQSTTPKQPGASVDQVCAWLIETELGEYASIFRENKIDGVMLLGLNEKDLDENFGMRNKYHRLRFLTKRSICAWSDTDLPAQPLSAVSAATTSSSSRRKDANNPVFEGRESSQADILVPNTKSIGNQCRKAMQEMWQSMKESHNDVCIVAPCFPHSSSADLSAEVTAQPLPRQPAVALQESNMETWLCSKKSNLAFKLACVASPRKRHQEIMEEMTAEEERMLHIIAKQERVLLKKSFHDFYHNAFIQALRKGRDNHLKTQEMLKEKRSKDTAAGEQGQGDSQALVGSRKTASPRKTDLDQVRNLSPRNTPRRESRDLIPSPRKTALDLVMEGTGGKIGTLIS